MMVAGSFHGTRTNGTVGLRDRLHRQRWFISTVPCWRSTQSASKPPWRAITSAENPWAMDSQPNVAHLLLRQISLILFARIAIPSL